LGLGDRELFAYTQQNTVLGLIAMEGVQSEVRTSIHVENVSLSFPIFNARSRSFKRALANLTTGGKIDVGKDDTVVVHALSNVSLTFDHGDKVALIGHNGAGKSTFLRVLAGAYEPNIGTIHRVGKIAGLFDLMLGMDQEATGHENINIRCLLNGYTPEMIEKKRAEISEFTELGDFLHMPIRTYSSGMLLRLGFAIATSIDPEILLMDEWMAAGDAAFLARAQARMYELIGQSGILVMASHSLELLRMVCNKAVWLDHGEVRAFGPAGETIDAYLSVSKPAGPQPAIAAE
jgi:lipopolysaccharide transport system ATP-binding protein